MRDAKFSEFCDEVAKALLLKAKLVTAPVEERPSVWAVYLGTPASADWMLQLQPNGERIEVRGCIPTYSFVPHGESGAVSRRLTITAAMKRGAYAVAGDIITRLLPAYLPVLAKSIEARDRVAAERAKTHDQAEELRVELAKLGFEPGPVHHEDRAARIYAAGCQVRLDTTGLSVEVRHARVTEEQLVSLLTVLS